MASERNKFSSMWVVEWFHKSSGEWTAVEGDTKLSRARSLMRKWREDTHFFKTGYKFRIAKYVRAGRGLKEGEDDDRDDSKVSPVQQR